MLTAPPAATGYGLEVGHSRGNLERLDHHRQANHFRQFFYLPYRPLSVDSVVASLMAVATKWYAKIRLILVDVVRVRRTPLIADSARQTFHPCDVLALGGREREFILGVHFRE